MIWSNTDPRLLDWKHGKIIILLSDEDIAVGYVETHHGYYVALSRYVFGWGHAAANLVGEDDKWPEQWYWGKYPNVVDAVPKYVEWEDT